MAAIHKNGKFTRASSRGFTLAELGILVVVIGILAAFGLPRFVKSVERSKAAEAFSYLDAVRVAQERHLAEEGVYAGSPGDLHVNFAPPRYFSVGPMNPGSTGTLASSWSLVLTRNAATGGYGAYTVIYGQAGYDRSSGIDRYSEIHPRREEAPSPSNREVAFSH